MFVIVAALHAKNSSSNSTEQTTPAFFEKLIVKYFDPVYASRAVIRRL
jgi:hypothetical protein